MPLLAGLGGETLDRLADLALEFLRHKALEGAGGLVIEPPMGDVLALQACLPVLELGLELYRGWYSVILYPGELRVPYEQQDEAGVVHQGSRDLAGEAWARGPVILAWSHVEQDALDPEPTGNLVIHEMAHKLDLRNGGANGMPALHRDMSPRAWSQAMSAAFADLQGYIGRRGRHPPDTPINPYAAYSPGELFAVTSELFFAWPERLWGAYPEVYRQLALYYRQDPLARVTPAPGAEGTPR
jgi:Mlc titration factor MtfA (ptsG expression regulator)